MPLPVLYSFRRCPYAMRARLALASAGISVELREILLRDKPAAMLEISPKGTVPVLQTVDGRILDESQEIMLWALAQNDPQHWRRDGDLPVATELMAQNDGPFKHWLDRSKYYERFPEQPRAYYRTEAAQILAQWEQRLSAHGGGLLRPGWGLADYALLPFVRQFAHSDDSYWASLPFPHLQNWLQQYESSALYQCIMPKWPVWDARGPGTRVNWAAPDN